MPGTPSSATRPNRPQRDPVVHNRYGRLRLPSYLNISKMSGYAVLALYHAKNTTVVVFTASSNEADAARAFSLGARGFVLKSNDLDAFKAAVSGMVQKWTDHDGTASESARSL